MKGALAFVAAAFLLACAFPAKSTKPSLDDQVVYIYSHAVDGICTGFVIDAVKRHVMTAAHCLRDATSLTVKLHNEQRFDATVVGISRDRDLAILALPETAALVAVRWGDSSKVKPGDEVLAVGHPLGERWIHKFGPVMDVYQSQINSIETVKFGNSGGPLFNERGEVVGVNVACMNMFMAPCAIGISISSNDARAVVQLIGDGE